MRRNHFVGSHILFTMSIHMGVTDTKKKKGFGAWWTEGRTLGTTLVSCFFEQTVPAGSCPWVAVLCGHMLWNGDKGSLRGC